MCGELCIFLIPIPFLKLTFFKFTRIKLFPINMFLNFNTDEPSAVNIRNPDDITNEPIVVQWNAVDDIFPVT